MDEEKKTSGIKVNDRRRIDEQGEDRDAAGGEKLQAQKSALSSTEQVEVREDTAEVNFSQFVMSLATQALMQLGQLQPPPGVDLAVDKEAARQTIDIIGMLSQKTKGNLDKEEQHLLDEILNSLRFQFVQKAAK